MKNNSNGEHLKATGSDHKLSVFSLAFRSFALRLSDIEKTRKSYENT